VVAGCAGCGKGGEGCDIGSDEAARDEPVESASDPNPPRLRGLNPEAAPPYEDGLGLLRSTEILCAANFCLRY